MCVCTLQALTLLPVPVDINLCSSTSVVFICTVECSYYHINDILPNVSTYMTTKVISFMKMIK